MYVPNFKILGAVVPEKSSTKTFIGEKEKWTNKGNDKHEDANSVLHNNQVIPNVCTKFQNPRYSSSWEILDEKKNLHTDTQTNIVTEKTKTYISPHTSYAGGIMSTPNISLI